MYICAGSIGPPTHKTSTAEGECNTCIDERRRLLDEAIRKDEAEAAVRQREEQRIERNVPGWRQRARLMREQWRQLQQRVIFQRAEEDRLKIEVRSRRARQVAQDSNRASRGSM